MFIQNLINCAVLLSALDNEYNVKMGVVCVVLSSGIEGYVGSKVIEPKVSWVSNRR